MNGDGREDADRSEPPDWPVDLRGVTETVVATSGPEGRWNVAALGVYAPDEPDRPATARTYGRTRTCRNFQREGRGVVQFTTDPREFVDAALTIREQPEPVLPNADAWVRVELECVGRQEEGDVTVRTWEVTPVEATVESTSVPTINRGFNAVIEATVAASRLDVPGFDTDRLLDRLLAAEETVERCGGRREIEAFERIDEAVDWRDRVDEKR